MKTLSVDDQTFKRLTSIMHDIMASKKHDVDYDYVINELIPFLDFTTSATFTKFMRV